MKTQTRTVNLNSADVLALADNIMESSLDLICLVGADHKIKAVNKATLNTLGYTEAELIGNEIFNFIHHEDVERTKEISDAVMKEGSSKNLNRYVCKDGSLVYLEWSAKWNEAAQLRFGIARDVTQRIVAENSLKQSEERFKSLVEFSTDIISILDANFCFTYTSPAMHSVMGYDGQKLLGRNFFEFTHPDEKAQALHKIESVALQQKLFFSMLTLRHANGEWRSTETTIVNKLQQSGILGYVVNSRDITERKIAEDELHNAKEIYVSLFDNSPAPMFVWAFGSLKIIDCNEAALALYGYTKSEFLQLSIRDIRPEEDKPLIDKETVSIEAYGKTNRKVWRHQKKDGTIMFLDITGNIIKYNSIDAALVVLLNITDKIIAAQESTALNESLQVQAKNLEDSNQALEQFAYVASHDLQEPLRMVTGFLSQLNNKYNHVLDEKGKSYIHFAVDGAKRMREIINGLLNYSKVNKTEETPEAINLNKLVDEIKFLLAEEIKSKAAVITLDDLPTIMGDKTPLLQIFQNTIGNALKYANAALAPVVHVGVVHEQTQWVFSIEDNGIGIPQEYLDHVFVIFKRLHTKEAYPGTGMGLAITKKIIEHLGGKIWVTSSLNVGTTFYFSIPK